VVVEVVVAPATVVAVRKAFWRTAGSSNADAARLTGSPKVLPPSFDAATVGCTGRALAPVKPGWRRPAPM
jgi:hypothetical protein